MQWVHRFFLLLLLIAGSTAALTPVTSIGSNPWYSTNLYPQDLLLRQGSYLFYCLQYQNAPFWGDIDEPANKPKTNVDYTITGANVLNDGGTFRHSGAVHSFLNNLGYAYQLDSNVMANVEFNCDIDALRNTAEGHFTGDTYPDGKTIPFNYSMGHTLGTFTGRAMFATQIKELPVGFQVEGGVNNSLRLTKTFTVSKYRVLADGTYDVNNLVTHDKSGDSARAFWGWAIPGCNHIFIERGTQGDSWLQNEYTRGPVYTLLMSGGLTMPKVKAGGSFRMLYGHQDRFYWGGFNDSNNVYGYDTVFTERYVGAYAKDDMARMTWLGEGRLFGNITLRSAERFSLNTFVAIHYADSSVGSALSDNLDAVNGAKDRKRSVGIEFFPNMSAKLGGMLNYVDIAGIFAYKYSRYSNTRETWVGGGVVQAFQGGSPSDGWSDMWENFSYANENVLDVGADISTMFPIFTEGAHHLFLNVHLFGDVRFTYQNKYYGESTASGSQVNFTLDNIRKNYTREVIFNTALMLHYLLGPIQLRFQFSKPVLYSILPRTEVTDADGNRVGSLLEKSPQLISLKGLTLGFYGSYDLVLPFLKR